VHVQIAAHLAELEELRERVALGPLDLSPILADLGRNPGKIDRRVDFSLGPPGDRLFAAEHAVLVDLQPPLLRRRRMTMLCSLEPVKYCIAAPNDFAGTTRRSISMPT